MNWIRILCEIFSSSKLLDLFTRLFHLIINVLLVV